MNDLYPNLFKNLTRNPISIVLLDGRKQTMVYDKTTKLSALFEESCALCGLDCDNLFGLATLMDDYYAFLNLDTKVCKINFKEISKKSQNNILFQSNVTFASPTHKSIEETRRLSQGNKRVADKNKMLLSTSSTKSAPVYSVQDLINTDKTDKIDTPVIYFRIKSYVFSHCLRDKTTKSLYFLQILRNVLDYKLKCVDEIYLQLGSFAIQAFYGDYNYILASSFDDRHSVNSSNTESSDYSHSPTLARLSRISTLTFNFTPDQVETGRYFDPKKFFPSWIIEKYTPEYLFKEIPQLHKSLNGMSRVEAEFSYIRMASAQYSNFNMHLFPVRDQKVSGYHLSFVKTVPIVGGTKDNGLQMNNTRLWLGLSPAGLEMHQMKQSDYLEHLSTLKWSDIDEVTHKSSRISIHVGNRSLKLNTNTKMQADHLFWLTRHMHMYQTKARLNATCTAESLESAERQKYREKYVYMDLEDLKLHGLQTPDIADQSEVFCHGDSFKIPSEVRLPFVNTPAAPPRRTPSKAKPLKMKDLMRMANSDKDSSNGSPATSFHAEKHPQYIKKSRPSSSQMSSYTPVTNSSRGVIKSSPDMSVKVTNEFNEYNSRFFAEDSEKTDCELSSVKMCEMLDDSDITSSINESGSRSPTMFISKQPGRFVSLSRDRGVEDDLSQYSGSPDHTSLSFLPPPQEFRESYSGTTHIGKSTSFDICDILAKQHPGLLDPVLLSPGLQKPPQRHQSDPQISYAQLSRSVPLLIGLCQEFNNTRIMDDLKSTSTSSAWCPSKALNGRVPKQDPYSVGMKSWKSDVLFNLNNCLDDEFHDEEEDDEDQMETTSAVSSYGGDLSDQVKKTTTMVPFSLTTTNRLNSLPRRPGSYRDLISLSSSSANSEEEGEDHESVDISSISSFEINDVKYSSKVHLGQPAQVTII